MYTDWFFSFLFTAFPLTNTAYCCWFENRSYSGWNKAAFISKKDECAIIVDKEYFIIFKFHVPKQLIAYKFNKQSSCLTIFLFPIKKIIIYVGPKLPVSFV